MYKRITCALCFVIFAFILAVIVYLILAEWKEFKPPTIQAPVLALYLVNGTTGEERRLHQAPNSECILNLQSYVLTDYDSPAAVIKFSQLELNSIKAKSSFLRIRCHSNYPVQLKYIGFGNVTEATNLNRRQIKDFIDRSTYNYSTELEFRSVDTAITGKYDCQIRDETNEAGIADSTFVYIYAAGLNTFISHSNRELIVEPDYRIEIPCPVSHPSKPISLFLVKPLMEEEVVREIDRDAVHTYDPKRGFVLDPNNYGEFYCKDRETHEVSGRVSVMMPLNKVLKGNPLKISSQNVNNTDSSLKLECRAKVPVDLKFINFIKFLKKTRTSKNESNEFPHSVRIKIETVEWFRGNVSIVECVTIGSRRVIKTWKFLKEDVPHDDDPLVSKVRLERVKDDGYQCCSYRVNMRPTLRTYPCSTSTECEFRLACLTIDPLRRKAGDPSCPHLESANEDIYQGDKGCTVLKFKGNGTGIIRCLLDAETRDFTYFHTSGLEGTYSSISNINKKKIEPSSVLKITVKRSRPGPVRFECEGSKLHFSSGFQWAVEKFSEKIKYLVNKRGFSSRYGDQIDASSTTFREEIDIPINDSVNRRIYCFAPLVSPSLFGQQWMNVSTTFRYNASDN